jgi:hypothetical protein
MTKRPTPGSPPEPELNELLRLIDWRFLLRTSAAPRTLDLHGGRSGQALRLVTEPAPRSKQEADLVVLGFPRREELRIARESLRPGGELVCLWQKPRPLGVRRARAWLRRAGFAEARFYWPGPDPAQAPEFWLPLESPAALDQVFSQRPPHSKKQAALRRAWRLAARGGTVGPICAVARLPANPANTTAAADPIDELLPDDEPWLLLTGGSESDNKAVGLPIAGSGAGAVAKFARVPKAATALDREAELLGRLERERSGLAGVPWLRAAGHRAGGRAIVQGAMHGGGLDRILTLASYTTVAPRMTDWLASLAGDPQPQPASTWNGRLVADPLDELERDFGDRVPAGLLARARRALDGFGELTPAWEHRDLGPWNVVIDAAGAPAVIDWEDAEPRGLPGLDLVYFLATSALLIDGALDDTSQVDRILASYRRLLDPSTAQGKVMAACIAEYRTRLGIGEEDFRRLRLLCWIVQALIANRRLPPGATSGDYFIHLAEDELRELETAP